MIELPPWFWAKVDKNGPIPACRPDLGPCWPWLGQLDKDGYGVVANSRKKWPTQRAARLAYIVLVEDIASDLHPDHLCRYRPCINPSHLEPVTCKVNLHRSPLTAAHRLGTQTVCQRGHPFDVSNTYIDKKGLRHCRECIRLNGRESARLRNGFYERYPNAVREQTYQPIRGGGLRVDGV